MSMPGARQQALPADRHARRARSRGSVSNRHSANPITDASPRDTNAVAGEPSLELLAAYGQSVSTVIAVFGLFVTAGAALVGLYAFAAASTSGPDTFDFGREFSRLLQSVAWTKIDGDVVQWRDVLLVQIATSGLGLLVLTASALATLAQPNGHTSRSSEPRMSCSRR